MKVTEIREISTEDLNAKVKDLQEQLFVLKFKQATGQNAEANQKKSIRKDIARILTILNERKVSEKK